MASKQDMLDMAARLRATISESKRQMLDEAADMLLEAAEAVERMTPRPINIVDIRGFFQIGQCSYCHAKVKGDMNYCGICGQALDWGNDVDSFEDYLLGRSLSVDWSLNAEDVHKLADLCIDERYRERDNE